MINTALRYCVSHVTGAIGVAGLASWYHRLSKMPYIRSVNYHWVAEGECQSFSRHCRYFQQHFTNIDKTTLDAFFARKLPMDKPGLIICFDDGYRNAREVAAPILEEYGLTGWFFAIAGLSDHHTRTILGGINNKACMSWDDLSDLQRRGHEIGCHTYSHCDISTVTGPALYKEVVSSKDAMEMRLGTAIESFCYPFGTADSYSRESLALLKQHYLYVFNSVPAVITASHSPYSLGRIPCEASWDVALVKFRLAGLLDWKYWRCRRNYRTLLDEHAVTE